MGCVACMLCVLKAGHEQSASSIDKIKVKLS